MDILRILIDFLKIYISPMVANGIPVVVSKFIKGRPLDRGKYLSDGKRILGDGKTVEGTIFAILTGTLMGAIIGILNYYSLQYCFTGFLGSLGGILGDITKSFFKRRIGIERGGMLPLVDQLDFYLGSTLFIYLCPICAHPSLDVFLFGIIIIPLLHLSTNYIAFKLHLKSVPW
ncbi:MAG: CDP-2,3-bis-(O-geranylgeranyl)-sn-glycerol synthase [Fervidicoccus fontis]